MAAGDNEDLEKSGELQMTFLEHLEELRHVLFKSALALLSRPHEWWRSSF